MTRHDATSASQKAAARGARGFFVSQKANGDQFAAIARVDVAARAANGYGMGRPGVFLASCDRRANGAFTDRFVVEHRAQRWLSSGAPKFWRRGIQSGNIDTMNSTYSTHRWNQ